MFNSQLTGDCIVQGAMVVKVKESDQEELAQVEVDWGVSVLEELDWEELDQEVSGPVPLARAVVHWESYLEVL